MIRNHLILIPFNLPWEWSTDYTNQTAYILSKENVVICYMWSESYSLKEYAQKLKLPRIVKKHSKNLYLYYPIFLIPFRRIRVVHNLNEKLNFLFLKVLIKLFELTNRTKEKLLWIFDPRTGYMTDYLGKGWKEIYDCVDFWSATAKTKEEKKVIEGEEKDLTKRADLVIAISTVLQKHLQRYRKDVYLVPQGFRLKDFENMKNYDTQKIKAKKPIIGFAGAINHRLDYNLLLSLAKNNPQWSFVIWGPVLEEEKIPDKVKQLKKKLLKLPNVSTGFLKDRKTLPGIIKQFDISIIPYDISQDFNKYCYPMKLFEYFYIGKPIVSTPIEELKRFPGLVKIGRDEKEWEKHIKSFLSKPWPKENKVLQKRLAEENSWENKVDTILVKINNN